MTAQIERLITEILAREGWPTYSDDPADRGGPTKGGITLKDVEAWRSEACTAEEVKALSEADARAIYAKKYIVDWKFDQIPDDWVMDFIVDTGVLQGQMVAAHVLQGTLNVPVDGDIGPVTLASLSMALRNPKRLRRELVRERMHHLLDAMCVGVLVELRQTTNLKWRHGWWNRVCEFLEE